jgi:hypothetical protein
MSLSLKKSMVVKEHVKLSRLLKKTGRKLVTEGKEQARELSDYKKRPARKRGKIIRKK